MEKVIENKDLKLPETLDFDDLENVAGGVAFEIFYGDDYDSSTVQKICTNGHYQPLSSAKTRFDSYRCCNCKFYVVSTDTCNFQNNTTTASPTPF